jgi:peptidoglycan/xylan/chitin deacetylase (PgdA/CDA1 family)
VRPTVGRAVQLRALWPLPVGPALAVLGWHRIDTEGGSLAVSPARFERQIAILDAGRHANPVMSIGEARALLAAPSSRARGVVLTFDDAWADNHANALGPLAAYRLPATLYVPSSLLGTPGYMTRSQVLEMAAAGIAIGAHSRTHADLRACGPDDLQREVRGSKDDLEDLTGRAVTSFAYPVGLLNEKVVRAVTAAGFTSAMTTRHGWWRPTTDLLHIPRGFAENFSERTFAAAARGGLNVLGPIGAIRQSARRGGKTCESSSP